jgi:hypothetical protein
MSISRADGSSRKAMLSEKSLILTLQSQSSRMVDDATIFAVLVLLRS